jgi:hypothetical protein
MRHVRPRFKRQASQASCLKLHPGSTSAVRCAGGACARNTGCRRRFEFCASAQGRSRDRFRLSALRRPSHGRVSSHQRRFAVPSKHSTSSIEVPSFQSASRASAVGAWLLLSVSIYRFSSSVARAACASSVGCFAIQIQSMVAAPRAWPNPSFKRTCLRHAA